MFQAVGLLKHTNCSYFMYTLSTKLEYVCLLILLLSEGEGGGKEKERGGKMGEREGGER